MKENLHLYSISASITIYACWRGISYASIRYFFSISELMWKLWMIYALSGRQLGWLVQREVLSSYDANSKSVGVDAGSPGKVQSTDLSCWTGEQHLPVSFALRPSFFLFSAFLFASFPLTNSSMVIWWHWTGISIYFLHQHQCWDARCFPAQRAL